MNKHDMYNFKNYIKRFKLDYRMGHYDKLVIISILVATTLSTILFIQRYIP